VLLRKRSESLSIHSSNHQFAALASDEQILKTIQALEANGMSVSVVKTRDEARQHVLDLLPRDSEIFTANPRTLEAISLIPQIEASPHWQLVRPHLLALRSQGKVREMRKVGVSPDVVIGSVHAVTEQGQVLIASGSGSQLASYAYGALMVIWVVGTSKARE
jgi:hypothetical protein